MSGDIEAILKSIAELDNFQLNHHSPLAGGSINQVFLLSTSIGERVVKINKTNDFPGMFSAEMEGLDVLQGSNSFDIPKVFSFGETGGFSYLILEYKPEGAKHRDFADHFAQNLTALHKNTSPSFGFKNSNYIGSLPQINGWEDSASDFYIKQRLQPQFELAIENGYPFGNLSVFYKNIASEIPDEPPALIHGDLWGGNYLINQNGFPCLIDPAVSYAPREMDFAMMKLFGGFSQRIFSAADEINPLSPGFEKRIPLWQLYYLLVHLNIFGSSYHSRVSNNIRLYS